MYPNPKTKLSQILCQIFSALCVFAPIAYVLGIIFLPFAPGNTAAGFIEIGPVFTSFLLVMVSLSGFLFALSVLLNIKRCIALATNEEGTGKVSAALNIIYIVLLFVTMLGALSLMLIGNENTSDKLRYIYTNYAWIWCPLLSAPLFVALCILSKKEKKGREKPVFETNIYRTPAFFAATVIVVLALLCIPVSGERRMYDGDTSECIYDRTNAFAYSYIKVENSETHKAIGHKFVMFPLNYMDTSELLGIK